MGTERGYCKSAEVSVANQVHCQVGVVAIVLSALRQEERSIHFWFIILVL